MCGKKKILDKVDEHDDTFNKDEVRTKPPLKYLYDRQKNNEYQELYEMPQKSFYDKFLNDKIMKLEMKMKVDRLKLILTGPVNYVLYIFKMFDRK